MRHLKAGKKLGRTTKHRQALFRNMVDALLSEERIQTTLAKAKEVRRHAERAITLGKRGDLHARRQALRLVRTKAVLKKLFETLGPRYAERPGGYTRILKLGPRPGDAAPMAILELVDRDLTLEAQKRERRRKREEKKERPEEEEAS
ncbi:MAG: 50S ribosomal protein L17 [Nitrospinota bacterium]